MVKSATEIWRDKSNPADPASADWKPVKSEIREWGAWLENVSADPGYSVKTWAALSAIVLTGSNVVGIAGEVVGPDSGTHTDPSTGATVANEGRYSWTTSGWTWISATTFSVLGDLAFLDTVGTTNINDLSITENKLVNGSVTNPKLAVDSVSTSRIVDTAVSKPKLSVAVQEQLDSIGTYTFSVGDSTSAIFVGDSLTAGFGAMANKGPIQKISAYTNILCHNYGRPGYKTENLLTSLRAQSEVFLGNVQQLRPKYGMILTGANDTGTFDERTGVLQQLGETLSGQGCEVSFTRSNYWIGGEQSSMMYSSLAERFGGDFVDVRRAYNLFCLTGVTPGFWYNNHPGTRTNDIFAGPLSDWIQKKDCQQSIKIFRARNDDAAIEDLNFYPHDFYGRDQLWREITVGERSIDTDNSSMFDTIQDGFPVVDRNSEYMSLIKGNSLNMGKNALVVITLPANAANLESVKINIGADVDACYYYNPISSPYAAAGEPVGNWASVTVVNRELTFTPTYLIRAVWGDQIVLLLKKSDSIMLSAPIVTWQGRAGKSTKQTRLGTAAGQYLASTDAGSADWTLSDGAIRKVPSDGSLPVGCTQVIALDAGETASQVTTLPAEPVLSRDVELTVWVRRPPTVAVGINSADTAKVSVGLSSGTLNATVPIVAGLWWRECKVRLTVPPGISPPSIIIGTDRPIEIARGGVALVGAGSATNSEGDASEAAIAAQQAANAAMDARDEATAAAEQVEEALESLFFGGRTELVAAVAAGELSMHPDGTSVVADGHIYVRQAGATAIPDMPNWIPGGPVPTVVHFGAVGDGVTDDRPALQAALDYATAAELYWPKPPVAYGISDILYVPPEMINRGGASVNLYETINSSPDTLGSVIKWLGPGTPRIWTDRGTETTPAGVLVDAPTTGMVVFTASGAIWENIPLLGGNASNASDYGFILPCVRRITIINSDTRGMFKETSCLGDTTWSSSNTALKDLHKNTYGREIFSDSGFNENTLSRCYFLSGNWGLKIQGTNRTDKSANIWAPAGTSDFVTFNCRIGNSPTGTAGAYPEDSGAYYVNVHESHQNRYHFGTRFHSNSAHCVFLDNGKREYFYGAYGESRPENCLTSEVSRTVSSVVAARPRNGDEQGITSALTPVLYRVYLTDTTRINCLQDKLRVNAVFTTPTGSCVAHSFGFSAGLAYILTKSITGTISAGQTITQAAGQNTAVSGNVSGVAYYATERFGEVSTAGTSEFRHGAGLSSSINSDGKFSDLFTKGIVSTTSQFTATASDVVDINCENGSYINFWHNKDGTGSVPQKRIRLSGATVIPYHVQNIGSATYRWDTVYTTNAASVSSDERVKTLIGDVPEAWLDAWGSVNLRVFKMISAVEEKGSTARWHLGLIAQQVIDAFAAHDIPRDELFTIGLIGFDQWEDEYEPIYETTLDEQGEVIGKVQIGSRFIREAGELYSLRYGECAILEAAYQRRKVGELEAALSSLSARVDALEGG